MSGPWSLTVTISAPRRSCRIPSSAPVTLVVTSMVLASGCLMTAMPTLGWPLVLDMLVGMPESSVMSATSPRVTGCGAWDGAPVAGCPGCPGDPGRPGGSPPNAAGLLTTSARRSSSDE